MKEWFNWDAKVSKFNNLLEILDEVLEKENIEYSNTDSYMLKDQQYKLFESINGRTRHYE